jgi:pimeloyl-ACP methyl ester carboxylesterase
MPLLRLPDGDLFYASRRAGDVPVVYVHGAGGEHSIWGYQLRAVPGLQAALDLPGHGRSPGPGRKTIPGYGAVVAGFVDQWAPGPAIVVGHSMGGAVAQWLALQRPHLVRGLLLVGTGARLRVRDELRTGFVDDPVRAARRLATWSFGLAADPAWAARAARQAAADPVVTAGDFAACHAFDVMERLGEIQVPTIALCGSEDVLTPPKYTHYLAARIPDASAVLVPEAGHMVMVERPGAVADALRRLIQGGCPPP